MLPTCHDDLIVGYSVNCEQRLIRLLGKQPDWKRDSRSWEISFEHVVAYRLTNDAFGNVISDIKKITQSDFHSEFGLELQESFARRGAAGSWAEDKNSTLQFLRFHSIDAYQISSSVGLEGWILSKGAKFAFT